MNKIPGSTGFAKAAACLGLALLVSGSILAQEAAPDYRNPRLPIQQRVADLLSRMTLEEKIGQLAPNRAPEVLDTTGKFDAKSARLAFFQMRGPNNPLSIHDGAILRNAVQR